jgi:hypothetical protein
VCGNQVRLTFAPGAVVLICSHFDASFSLSAASVSVPSDSSSERSTRSNEPKLDVAGKPGSHSDAGRSSGRSSPGSSLVACGIFDARKSQWYGLKALSMTAMTVTSPSPPSPWPSSSGGRAGGLAGSASDAKAW